MLYPTGDHMEGDNHNSQRLRNYNEGIRYVAMNRENLAKDRDKNRYLECCRAVKENRSQMYFLV